MTHQKVRIMLMGHLEILKWTKANKKKKTRIPCFLEKSKKKIKDLTSQQICEVENIIILTKTKIFFKTPSKVKTIHKIYQALTSLNLNNKKRRVRGTRRMKTQKDLILLKILNKLQILLMSWENQSNLGLQKFQILLLLMIMKIIIRITQWTEAN